VLKGDEEMGILSRKPKKIVVPTSPSPHTSIAEKKNSNKTKKAIISREEKAKTWKNTDINEWNVAMFRQYFYDKYLDRMEMPHPSLVKHKGMMNNALKALGGDNELLKKHIDAFFEIGYDNLTLDFFCSSARLGEIQTFLASGKKPFYLEKKNQTQAVDRYRAFEEGQKEQKQKATEEDLKRLFGGN
jgi:hypothetical protein